MNILPRLFRDRSGAFAPILALVAAVLIVSVGMGLDYARALNDRGHAQSVADSMVLAMANVLRFGGSEDEARDAARRVYDGHFGAGSDKVTLEMDPLPAFSGIDLLVSFPGLTETTLMKLARFGEVPWQVSSTSRVGMENLELSLVVDISHSMLAKNKMAEMRQALTRLVTAVFPAGQSNSGRVINLVPYADAVSFDSKYKDWSVQRSAYNVCFRPEPIEDIINNTTNYIGKLELFNTSFSKIGGIMYPLCPNESTVVLAQNNPETLLRAVSGFENGWGTGTDIGLMWGWRFLSPQWRAILSGKAAVPGYPRDFSVTNSKMIVVLTDGHTIRYDSYGDGSNVYSVRNGVSEPGTMEGRFAWATDRLKATCDAIAREGKIKLFTIGYDMEAAADAPRQNAMKVLKECPANGGRHYDADYGALVDTIDKIIAEFNTVRIYE